MLSTVLSSKRAILVNIQIMRAFVRLRNLVADNSVPGPAGSQLGVSIGVFCAGLPSGMIVWLCFTLPSAVTLFFFGPKRLFGQTTKKRSACC